MCQTKNPRVKQKDSTATTKQRTAHGIYLYFAHYGTLVTFTLDYRGICVSKTAFDHIETKVPLRYEFLGEQDVKNIAKPVGAYRVLMETKVTVAEVKKSETNVPFWRRKAIISGAIAIFFLIFGTTTWKNFT